MHYQALQWTWSKPKGDPAAFGCGVNCKAYHKLIQHWKIFNFHNFQVICKCDPEPEHSMSDYLSVHIEEMDELLHAAGATCRALPEELPEEVQNRHAVQLFVEIVKRANEMLLE